MDELIYLKTVLGKFWRDNETLLNADLNHILMKIWISLDADLTEFCCRLKPILWHTLLKSSGQAIDTFSRCFVAGLVKVFCSRFEDFLAQNSRKFCDFFEPSLNSRIRLIMERVWRDSFDLVLELICHLFKDIFVDRFDTHF